VSRRTLISINFAGTDYRRAARLRTGVAAAIVALLAVGGGLVWQARADRTRAADVEARIRELSAAEEKLRPALEDRRKILDNLGAMTALVDARRFSWTRLLTGIEAAFPAGAALSRIEFAADRTVSLEGEAQSPEALSGLMIGLGRSPSFRNPLLKRQSMDKGIISFNVTVTYQDSMAAGLSSGPVRRQDR
jgi:Tfp pilus assembly protein PilN